MKTDETTVPWKKEIVAIIIIKIIRAAVLIMIKIITIGTTKMCHKSSLLSILLLSIHRSNHHPRD